MKSKNFTIYNLFFSGLICLLIITLNITLYSLPVFSHAGHGSSVLIPYSAPEGLAADFINALVKPVLPLPDIEDGKVSALDTPWNWPSVTNPGSNQPMNVIDISRTDSDKNGYKECRYFFKLDTMSAKYTAAEITEIENDFDRAFNVWNSTINQLGLEFKRVSSEADAHMLVKSVATLGSGTPAQASLFGAFFYSGVSPMVPELLVNENYEYFSNFSDLVIGANTKIKVSRPAGNPYVNVVSYFDLNEVSTVNSTDYTRTDPVFRTAIHEIGHLLGFNHTFQTLGNSSRTSTTEYIVDWLAYTDINTAYTAMTLTNAYDNENPYVSGAVRGLNNSFMTYEESQILFYIDITPHQKAALAFIYRDAKNDSRAGAAAVLAAAKKEFDQYNTFRHSRIKCEIERASATVTNNNTKDNAMSISIGDSVLGSIGSWNVPADAAQASNAQQDTGADSADFYSFTVTSDMLGKALYFDIDFGSTLYATKLSILDADGTVLKAHPTDENSSKIIAPDWSTLSGAPAYPDNGSHYDSNGGSFYNVPDPFIIYTPSKSGNYYIKVEKNTYINMGGYPWGDYYLRTSADAVTAKPTVTCAQGVSFTTASPTINWTAAANASEYILEYRKQGASEWTSNNRIGSNLTSAIDLADTGVYEVRVMGYNAMNENLATQPWSDTLTITRTDPDAQYKVTVNITPASAVLAGAKWRTSLNETWLDSGAFYSMAGGTKFTYELKTVRGWIIGGSSPSEEITMGVADISYDRSYTADTAYSFSIVISNPAAIAAGAKWRLTAPAGVAEAGFYDWKDSGASLNLYDKEIVTIEFGPATGFTPPASVNGTMDPNNVTLTTGTGSLGAYTVITHNLTVNITPTAAVTAGAKWQLAADGATWRDSGSSAALAENTDYTVSFNTVTGYVKPADQPGTLTTSDVNLSGAYTEDAAPTITITAPGSSDVTANTSYTITWTDEDADSAATISLYLDKTTTWQGDELLLLSGISEDADGTADLQDKLELSNSSTDARKKMKDIPAGIYYVLAVIDDSNHAEPTRVWSTGKLKVDHSGTISEVAVSNITKDSASITFISGDSGTASVNYSLTAGALDSSASDYRGAASRKIHSVLLTGLLAESGYKYNAQLTLDTAFEGMNDFLSDNLGENFTFTTAVASKTRTPALYTVRGRAVDEQGAAVSDALVLMEIAAAADSGTVNQGQTSYKLSAVTLSTAGNEGKFSFELASLTAPDGDGFMYAAGDTIKIKVLAGDKGQYEGTYTLGSSSPQDLYDITVRTEYTQKIALAAGFNLVSFPLDFSASPVTAKSLIESYSALAAFYSWDNVNQRYISTIRADASTILDDGQTITPGVGYWVKAASGVTIEVTGKILTNPVTLSLKQGFSLVGFSAAKDYPSSLLIDAYKSTDPVSGAVTSYKDFINSITDGQGKAASAIYSWNSSTGSYDGVLMLNDEPYLIKAFPVELTKAYFIKVIRDVDYTHSK